LTPDLNDNASEAHRAPRRAVPDTAPCLFLPLASSPRVTGMSRTSAYRRHAEALASGQEGFLVKCGRTTMVDLRAFQRFMDRQPRAVVVSDIRSRPARTAA